MVCRQTGIRVNVAKHINTSLDYVSTDTSARVPVLVPDKTHQRPPYQNQRK